MPLTKSSLSWLSLIFALLLLIASTGAAFLNARALVAAHALVDHSHQVLGHLRLVLSYLAEAESGQRGYIITGDPDYTASFNVSVEQAHTHLQLLRALTADDPTQQLRLDDLDELVARRVELLRQVLLVRHSLGFEAGQRIVQSGAGKQVMDEIALVIREMDAEERARLVSRAAASARTTRSAVAFFVIGTLVSVAVLFVTFLVLRQENRQRRHTEAALAHESRLLHVLMDTLPDLIYFKDSAARFTRVNRSHAAVLGLADPRQAAGKTELELQPGQLAEGILQEEQQLIATGQPLIDRLVFSPTSEGQPRWFSATKMPIIVDDGAITGIVAIAKDVTQRVQIEQALQQSNERLSRALADQEQHNRAMQILTGMLDLLQSCDSVEEALSLIARSAQRLLPVSVGALYLIDASRNLVEAAAVWGECHLPGNEVLLQPSDCWALRRGRAHWVPAADQGDVCRHVSSGLSGSSLCVPMTAQGETLGLIHLRRAAEPGAEAANAATVETAFPMAVALAEHLSLALANLRLRETLRVQAIRDPLTGLFNRRYMEEVLNQELNRAERRGVTFALVMVDIDHFKQFNDTFGHAAGDALLQAFGDYLRRVMRGEDIACRYGGEEFTLVITDVTSEQAAVRADQLRAGVSLLDVQHQGQILRRVTASMGLALYPLHGRTTAALLRSADAALYQAKSGGRDRLVVAELPA